MSLKRPTHYSTPALLLGFLGMEAQAEMLPLDETVTDRTEISYQYLRCASLYGASLAWSGNQLDQETQGKFETAASSLLQTTVFIRSASNPDAIESISEIVLKEADMIAELYLEQFQQSYAVTGNAWDGNEIWEKDIKFCQPVAQAAIVLMSDKGETQ